MDAILVTDLDTLCPVFGYWAPEGLLSMASVLPGELRHNAMKELQGRSNGQTNPVGKLDAPDSGPQRSQKLQDHP